MNPATIVLSGALLALGLAAAMPAHAADAPTADERNRIETKLRSLGFERWRSIEREDDGREWEVDDARMTDGREFDVRLATDDLREISRKGDTPSNDQRAQIEGKLRALGFTSWSDIESRRGGRDWEVEDARTADGRKFDMRLAADDLRELSRKPD